MGNQLSRGLRSQSCSSSESEFGGCHGLFLTVNPIAPTGEGGGAFFLPQVNFFKNALNYIFETFGKLNDLFFTSKI